MCACVCLLACVYELNLKCDKTKKGKQTKKGKGDISNISNGTEEKRSKKSKGSSVQYASFYLSYLWLWAPFPHIFTFLNAKFQRTVVFFSYGMMK